MGHKLIFDEPNNSCNYVKSGDTDSMYEIETLLTAWLA